MISFFKKLFRGNGTYQEVKRIKCYLWAGEDEYLPNYIQFLENEYRERRLCFYGWGDIYHKPIERKFQEERPEEYMDALEWVKGFEK